MSPVRPPPDYEKEEGKMWVKNAESVVHNLDAGDQYLLKKMKTFRDRFGYSIGEIEINIRTSPIFAAHFTKQPSRQGFHERLAFEWLKKELSLDIEILPKGGGRALYVTRDGMIIPLPKEQTKMSKSLDFKWMRDGVNFYAMHKYTKEGGGAQDNQFNEIMGILENFYKASDKKNVLIAIVDGPYYNQERMEKLKNLTRSQNPKSFAVPIECIPDIMDEY